MRPTLDGWLHLFLTCEWGISNVEWIQSEKEGKEFPARKSVMNVYHSVAKQKSTASTCARVSGLPLLPCRLTRLLLLSIWETQTHARTFQWDEKARFVNSLSERGDTCARAHAHTVSSAWNHESQCQELSYWPRANRKLSENSKPDRKSHIKHISVSAVIIETPRQTVTPLTLTARALMYENTNVDEHSFFSLSLSMNLFVGF